MKPKITLSLILLSLIITINYFYISANTIHPREIDNPIITEEGHVTWNCIYFGNYWQTDTNGDGIADKNEKKTPIKWRVLSKNGDDIFIQSDMNLDCLSPYINPNETYKTTWENCVIREWLNNDFYNEAFSSDEQNDILITTVINNITVESAKLGYPILNNENNTNDKIYILSGMETLNTSYGFSDDLFSKTPTRESKNTEYTNNLCMINLSTIDNVDNIKYSLSNWWTRSFFSDGAYIIDNNGEVCSCSNPDYFNITAIRPVLHLKLSSSLWDYAGTVSAEGGVFSPPTSSPSPSLTPAETQTPTPSPKPSSNTKTPVTASTTPPAPTDSQNEQPVSTPPKTVSAPGRPQKLAVKNNKKKTATVSWKKVKKANGYQVQYATNSAFSKKKVKNTKKTKLVIRKLKKKKTYCFRVRAYKTTNGAKKYGKWSKVKKIKIKK